MANATDRVNSPGAPGWGRKPYTYDAPLVNRNVDPVTTAVNLGTLANYRQVMTRPYVPFNSYPVGTPINPLAARRAGNTYTANPYVMAFESWINNGKAVFGRILRRQP